MSGGATWSKAETLLLISTWGQDHIQRKLQECKKNQSIYEEVAQEMKDAGYNRTYQQCRDKIKKLKVEYKKEKDRTGKTGEEKSTWDYFQEMDSILGHKPSTRPPVVIESMNTDGTDDQALEEPLPECTHEESISNESDRPSISSSITSIPQTCNAKMSLASADSPASSSDNFISQW